MATWLSDDSGNKCSVEYFGSREAAQEALDSLKNCRECIDCSGCSRCKNVASDLITTLGDDLDAAREFARLKARIEGIIEGLDNPATRRISSGFVYRSEIVRLLREAVTEGSSS